MYRHQKQHRWHLARHGPIHLYRHWRTVHHGHHRKFIRPEVRRRNRIVALVVSLFLLTVALIALAAFSYGPLNRARSDLQMAHTIIENDLHNKALLTTAGGRFQLQQDIGAVSTAADLADQSITNSTALRILGVLPVIGTQRHGLIQLSTDVEEAAATGNYLLGAINRLVAASHGTTVSLPELAGLEYFVVEGRLHLAALDRPTGGLVGPIGAARSEFDQQDAKLVRLLALSAKTITFARPFLGDDGPQTYLVAGENNAEMRDGGAVLSLDVLTSSNGTFTIAQDASYGQYTLSSPADVTLPAGTQKIFGAYKPTQEWPDVDATADFALTGESMRAMWAEATGQQVNGVIGIDLPGVISLLKLTGPVLVPGIGQPINASNAADILLNREYIGDTVNDPQNARRDKIAAVVKAAVDRMRTEHVDLDAFASALSRDVEGRHLMVWSAVPSTESGLASLDAAGTLTTGDRDRSFHVAVENSTSDKLDYFVGVGVKMDVTVDSSGNALINTTISVANHALPGQPPSYQYGPDDVNAFTPGQYVARIFFWGPRGADVPDSTPESGLQLAQSHFSLLPGQHNLVTFATVIPDAVVHGRLQLHLIPQARLVPDHFSLELHAPGWTISGPRSVSKKWSDTINLDWGLSR